MSEGEKASNSSSHTPTILVLLLAVFGLTALPQGGGGGKTPDPGPNSPENQATAAATRDLSEDEKSLGPLAMLRAYREHEPSGVKSPSCPLPASPSPCDVTDASGKPFGREFDEILRAEPYLQFLTVLVPDPDRASMSHQFDPTLSAAQRAVESAGFVAMRWTAMPGFPPSKNGAGAPPLKSTLTRLKGAAGQFGVELTVEDRPAPKEPRVWPAAVLCRPTRASDDAVHKNEIHLLLMLVPESPTLGVDQARLSSALALNRRHEQIHAACDHSPRTDHSLRLVGPNFSGSIRSLTMCLRRHVPPPVPNQPPQAPSVIIYNGTASAPNLEHFWAMPPGSVRFRSTVYDNKALESAVRKFIDRTTPWWEKPPRLAILIESNTGAGQQLRAGVMSRKPEDGSTNEATSPAEYFAFPLNVSQIREEYAAKGFLRANETLKLQSPERLTPLEMAGKQGDNDLISVVTPGPSAVAGELSLVQTLTAIERGRFTWVGIVATNPYDRLFLAEKVRVACPNARLFFTSASTLYAHHSVVPYLRGTVIASTYPLDPETQRWTASPGWTGGKNINRFSFGNHFEEGIYNATVAHLADLKFDPRPKLLDYADPGTDPKRRLLPPVWISVVGQRGLYPVSVMPAQEPWFEPEPIPSPAAADRDLAAAAPAGLPRPTLSQVGGLYRPPADMAASLPDGIASGLLDPSWVGVILTICLGSFFGSLWYLWACFGFDDGRVSVPVGLRQRIDHSSSRKLAAVAISAAFGQVILLTAPVGILQTLQSGAVHGWVPRVVLLSLVVITGMVTGLAAVVAFFRLIMEGGTTPVGTGEMTYRVITGSLWLGQFALPLYYAVDLTQGRYADLRVYYARATHLVNGVSPVIPFLLLGIGGGTVLLGDWLRIGLRLRLVATSQAVKADRTGVSNALAGGLLKDVWTHFQAAHRALDVPPSAWHAAGLVRGIPFWVLIALLGIALTDGLPKAVEPSPLFLIIFYLASFVTLGLVVVRLLDLAGLCRVVEQLLRRMAEIPMSRAFDRIPAHFGHENFWRPYSDQAKAGVDSDPRIDRQFQAVASGYPLHTADSRLGSVDPTAWTKLDDLIRAYSRSGHLSTRNWWRAVAVLSPFLEKYWATRPLISPGDEGKASRLEWGGLPEDDGLRHWLRSAEDLIAMIMVRQLAWLRASITTITSFLVVGLVGLSLVLTSYPFEPQGPMFGLIGSLAAVTVGVFIVIAVQASRDEVLSRINKTLTDRFTFDRQFVTMVVTYVVPLVGLLGALSYSLSDLFRSLLEPFFRAG